MAVDDVQPLLAGEDAARLGDPSVGHHHHDIPPVDRAAGPVEDLEFRGAHRGASFTVPAVLALDHPAASQRIGGLHVRSQITLPADLDGVGAAVPVHQVAHRVLELLVGERVQLDQSVA